MAVETSQLQTAAAAQPQAVHASERYRYYVVWFLFLVYVFNFVDRQILTTLTEPIKTVIHAGRARLSVLVVSWDLSGCSPTYK
ncbi:MAG: hypothetical protein ACREXP_05520, partial [Steroidobacteraceae bacterium]